MAVSDWENLHTGSFELSTLQVYSQSKSLRLKDMGVELRNLLSNQVQPTHARIETFFWIGLGGSPRVDLFGWFIDYKNFLGLEIGDVAIYIYQYVNGVWSTIYGLDYAVPKETWLFASFEYELVDNTIYITAKVTNADQSQIYLDHQTSITNPFTVNGGCGVGSFESWDSTPAPQYTNVFIDLTKLYW